MIPAGVHGDEARALLDEAPDVLGVEAVHVLVRADAVQDALGVHAGRGNGSWTRIPWISRAAGCTRRHLRDASAVVALAGSRRVSW